VSRVAGVTVRVPHGLWDDGACHRQAVLHPPGWEAVAALAGADHLPAAAWTTQVLAACVEPLPGRDVLATAAAWTLGDRAALLLEVHRLLTGGPLAIVADCPSCKATMEAELGPDDLRPPERASSPWHDTTVAGVRVRFRVPTGADLEAADGTAGALLRRIVLAQDGDVPADLLEAHLSDQVAELDPQAEILLALACPACAAPVDALLDPVVHVRADLARAAERTALEVHGLARHYGWSEQAILALPAERRARYLALVGEAP
jgi:hypothetical protein